MHYHECAVYVDPSAAEVPRRPSPRRVIVNETFAVSHHYRPCYTTRHKLTSCDKLLAKTYLDDTVLRYRDQLITNVQQTQQKALTLISTAASANETVFIQDTGHGEIR